MIRAFPDPAWEDGEPWHQPWYLAFHTIFWLDFYLAEGSPDFRPPEPFTLGEMEPGRFPERPYAKEELLGWLGRCRDSLSNRLSTLSSDAAAARTVRLPWGEMGAAELLLYNLRHVQHHTAQLNQAIRRAGGEPAPWIMRTDGL